MDLGDGVIEITIHVIYDDLDRIIYDLEIFYDEQEPKWGGAEPISWPEGWHPAPVAGGIGFATDDSPLIKCQPVKITIQVSPPIVGDVIWIHLTDKDHNNLGYIVSQRPSLRIKQ